MKWDRSMLLIRRLPIRFLFLAGCVAGLVAAYLWRGTLFEKMGMPDEDTLYYMKYMAVDNRMLFWYVLCKRGRDILVCIIMATTYLGMIFCGGITVKYGYAFGFFLSSAIYRYGAKGILLGLIGIFPHYLVYIPAAVLLIRWCEDIYRSIYFYHNITGQGKSSLPGRLGRLVLILGALAFGCVLECFVNPGLLKGFLQFF